MSANILDAIQGLATPAMIKTAASSFGLSETAATAALGAASTGVLGGLLQQSGDAGAMAKVASLAGALAPDPSMFANVTGLLSGGIPSSPAHTIGNRLLGQVFGDKTSSAVAAVASATGVSTAAASGMTTLAAPMVLAALRSRLGAAPTAAGLTGLLSADRNLIASAMPPALRTVYGLAAPMPQAVPAVAAAPAAPAAVTTPILSTPTVAPTMSPAAPVVAAAASAAAAAASAVAKPVAAPVAAAPTPAPAPAPVAQTSSGHASAPSVSTVAAPTPAPAFAAAPKVTPVVAGAAATAAASAAVRPAAPAAAPAAASVVTPAASATAAAMDSSPTSPVAVAALLLPLAILAGLIWYWAYGLDGGKSAISAVKQSVAPTIAPPATPKPAAPAPAPALEVKKVEAAPAPAPVAPAAAPAPVAAAPAALVPVPGANGMVKYTLPGGAAIDVAKDGVESKLLSFITSKDSVIDKKLWFDFDKLSFDTGSTNLTADSKAQISTVAAILKAYPTSQIKIGGYTDNQGDPDANMKLSDARAKRVMEEIVGSGIAADRVQAEGYGEQFPVGDNATPEGRAKNRRTSLSVRQK
jgi:outer membrane protein OmpA-like peptidoglycan-associated protein